MGSSTPKEQARGDREEKPDARLTAHRPRADREEQKKSARRALGEHVLGTGLWGLPKNVGRWIREERMAVEATMSIKD